jgi:hypothetical protein
MQLTREEANSGFLNVAFGNLFLFQVMSYGEQKVVAIRKSTESQSKSLEINTKIVIKTESKTLINISN